MIPISVSWKVVAWSIAWFIQVQHCGCSRTSTYVSIGRTPGCTTPWVVHWCYCCLPHKQDARWSMHRSPHFHWKLLTQPSSAVALCIGRNRLNTMVFLNISEIFLFRWFIYALKAKGGGRWKLEPKFEIQIFFWQTWTLKTNFPFKVYNQSKNSDSPRYWNLPKSFTKTLELSFDSVKSEPKHRYHRKEPLDISFCQMMDFFCYLPMSNIPEWQSVKYLLNSYHFTRARVYSWWSG